MKNTKLYYGWMAISLHWLVALAVFTLFALGYWMVDLDYYDEWYKPAPALHKSIGIGISLFVLMLFRLCWRAIQIKPEPLASHQAIEKLAAHAMHLLLYIVLFLIMVSAYLISTADGRGIEVFGWFEIPGFGALFENQEDLAGLVHQYAAYSVIALVVIHAAGALKHHFVDKDKTLKRMLGKPN